MYHVSVMLNESWSSFCEHIKDQIAGSDFLVAKPLNDKEIEIYYNNDNNLQLLFMKRTLTAFDAGYLLGKKENLEHVCELFSQMEK